MVSQTADDYPIEPPLDMLDVDQAGFDIMDRKLLLAVLDKFEGGPVGIDNLANFQYAPL